MQDYEYLYEICLCSVLEDRPQKVKHWIQTDGQEGDVCRVRIGSRRTQDTLRCANTCVTKYRSGFTLPVETNNES
jgi:hypothetical protein